MAKALAGGADEAKSGGMGTGRASRTPRVSPGAILTELWAPQEGYDLRGRPRKTRLDSTTVISVVEFTTRPSIRIDN